MALFFVVTADAEPTPPSDNVSLAALDDSMVVRATVPLFENQWFLIMLPKTVGEKSMSMVNTPDATANWEEHPDRSLTWTHDPGILLRFSIRIVPQHDHVRAYLTLTNNTHLHWEDPWFMTLFAPHGAEEFRLENGASIRLPVDGNVVESTSISRANNVHEFMTAVPSEDSEIPHFLHDLGCTAEDSATESWMIASNQTETRWISLAASDSVFHFTNDQISSLHVAPNFGDIAPGETASTELIFRFGEGTVADAINSARSDVATLAETAENTK